MKQIKNIFNKKIVRDVLGIFITSRLLILFVGYLSNLIIIKGKWFGKPKSLLNLFFRWDSGWYMSIVKNGYKFIPGKQSSAGFFPLYPFLVKAFSLIFGNPRLMGFIISNVALLVGAFYLYKLIRLDFNDSIAAKTIFYMMIFPTSFFFSIFYNEGLFIFLAVAAFYYARKRQWLTASIFGFFISLTKILGVFVFIPLVFEYFNFRIKDGKIDFKDIKLDLFYLLLIPFGLIVHMSYLYLKFGDALAFLHAQAAWSVSFVSIFTTLSNIYYGPFYRTIFLGSILVALFLIIYLIYSKVRLSYIIYPSLFLSLYLSSNSLSSIHRYIVVLFPLYLGISLIASKSKFWDYFFSLFSIMLLTLFVVLFVNGYWIV